MNIIIAPHPDDELIGCFEVINSGEECIIVYTEDVYEGRIENAKRLERFKNIKGQIFNRGINAEKYYGLESTYYYPDPHFELHPAHRKLGMEGEQLARDGFDVVFYTTNMNAPYIHEVKCPTEKETLLDQIYPDQKDMWKYEKKYVLFEGYNKWIFK